MNAFRELVRQALGNSGRTQNALVFPTILAAWSDEELKSEAGVTRDDVAIKYLEQYGFGTDRVRKNLRGYPGLFRELDDSPPWVNETLEDTEGAISPDRQRELRPLYLQAAEASVSDLCLRFKEYQAVRNSVPAKLGIVVPPESELSELHYFEEKLLLARCIGSEKFEDLYEAIFDLDDMVPAIGAPDLFVWDLESQLWFFAELKGPHDHLRANQAAWLRSNWKNIEGRFALLIVPPNDY